ncbi:MAG: single-stranded DNA-binding protein [Deltaproteobacteria bacterium]|nr:single-stranded DNA-binding protein [Deltaproteobacteria bacterium]
MKSLNKVMLIGNLGGDPEIRYTAAGVPVARFSLATNEVSNGKNGDRQEQTEWHRIVAWGKLAEICGKHLTKGKQVYIEGQLRSRAWEQDGSNRSATEVVARSLIMLGTKATNGLDCSLPLGEDDIPM